MATYQALTSARDALNAQNQQTLNDANSLYYDKQNILEKRAQQENATNAANFAGQFINESQQAGQRQYQLEDLLRQRASGTNLYANELAKNLMEQNRQQALTQAASTRGVSAGAGAYLANQAAQNAGRNIYGQAAMAGLQEQQANSNALANILAQQRAASLSTGQMYNDNLMKQLGYASNDYAARMGYDAKIAAQNMANEQQERDRQYALLGGLIGAGGGVLAANARNSNNAGGQG